MAVRSKNTHEINHLFPLEIRSGQGHVAISIQNLMTEIGFNLDYRGNKMSLLVNETVRDAIQGNAVLKGMYERAGVGLNVHDSSRGAHPAYNEFIIGELGDIADRATMESWRVLTCEYF